MAHFINCCYKCPDRYPGCHDHGDKYQQKRAEWDALKAKDRLERSIDGYLSGGVSRSKDAEAKRKKTWRSYRRQCQK